MLYSGLEVSIVPALFNGHYSGSIPVVHNSSSSSLGSGFGGGGSSGGGGGGGGGQADGQSFPIDPNDMNAMIAEMQVC